MSSTFKTVLDQVYQLSRAEQLALIEEIARLLRESEDEEVKLPAAWEEELDKRDALLDTGEMPVNSWEEVKNQIISE